jgi:diguanylate cyclase (GGDEF)-like protein
MGDVVLARVGRLLTDQCRVTDIAGRWGGEEFVVALTSASPEGAVVCAERIRRALESLEIQSDSGKRVAVTASIGLASWQSGDALDALVERADHAMYAAKQAGRNQVKIAPSPKIAPPSAEPVALRRSTTPGPSA